MTASKENLPNRWRTLRIFISSTFRDMHAERDHLVRFVFPELKEKCRQKKVHLIDVDLRWGVTEEDAERGKALDICLDEIDSCRPYFLGLLGHRYGFTPPGQEHSITAQEIYHGVLHNDIPNQIVDLHKIIEGKLEGKVLSNEQVNCLVRCYQYDADKNKYLFCDDASDDDLKIIRSVFREYSAYQRDRSFFFFRSKALTEQLSGENRNDFFETDKGLIEKLKNLKQEIIDDAGLPYFDYDDIETFENVVSDVLWKRIENEIEERTGVQEKKDWLEEESEFHELFMADRTRRFVGRRYVLDKMHAFCESDDEPSIMVITGEPGSGKSALMARYTEEVIHSHPDWTIIPHFVGASLGSTNLRQTLKRFCTHLNPLTDASEEVPEDIKELIQIFPDLLAKAAKQRNILIILDAVNQLEKSDNVHDLRWLPQELPENIRLVISTLKGEAFEALQSRRIKPNVEEVMGLNENEIRELVANYLKEIRHEFPNKQVEQTFFEKIKAGSPLYIQVALEELRVFGEFEKLGQKINKLPDNVPALFGQVLERIESDFDRALVRDCMSLIACGKHGMTAEELQTLLRTHAPHTNQATQAEKLPDMIWTRLYRAFSSYLFERSGVIDFFHSQLKEAVGKKYLHEEADHTRIHKAIADYFETRWREPYNRALNELPHQLVKAEDWKGVEQVLTDLNFIEGKCMAGMTYKLITDYANAIDVGDKSWHGYERIKEFKKFFREQAYILKHYPGLTFQQAINQPDKSRVYKVAFKNLSGGLVNQPWLQLENKSTHLCTCAQTLVGHSQEVVSCAIFPDGSRIASISYDNTLKIWNANTGRQLLTISDELGGDTCCAIFPDCHRIVTALGDKSLKIWTDTGKELATLKGHSDFVRSCEIYSDGTRIVSGSDDRILIIWDANNYKELYRLKGHSKGVNSCAISPDGNYIVSASKDKTLKLWDAKGGKGLATLRGHSDWVNACAISQDSSRIVSASSDKTLKLWDAESGEELFTLRGHSDDVFCCAISPDGNYIVSASMDTTLKLWNIQSGKEIRTFKGHVSWVTSCAIFPDGQRFVSTSWDGSLKLWDINISDETAVVTDNSIWFGREIPHAISIDARYLISRSWDSPIDITDSNSRENLGTYQYHSNRKNDSDILPDGYQDSSDKYTISLWNIKDDEVVSSLDSQPDWHQLVYKCSISSDGCRVVSPSGDEGINIWDVDTGHELHVLKGHSAQSGMILSCAINPVDYNIITASIDHTLKLWAGETGDEITTLKGHTSSVNSCAFSPDGRHIVSSSSDSTLKLWNAGNGEELFTLRGHSDKVLCCAISPDGKYIISSSADKTLKLWNAGNGEELFTLRGHSDEVLCCAMSPDGKYIISSSADKTLKLWGAETGNEILTLRGHTDAVIYCAFVPDVHRIISVSEDKGVKLWDANTGVELSAHIEQSDGSTCCAVFPDGHRVLFETYHGTLIIRDTNTGTELLTLESPLYSSVTSCAISSDGHRIVLAYYNDSLEIWDVEKGELLFALEGHYTCFGKVLFSAITPDNSHVVSASDDRTLKLWDIQSGQEMFTFTGHTDQVTSCTITPDNRHVVSTSMDKTLKLWDIRNGEELFTFKGHSESVISCAISPGGRYIASTSDDDTLKIWNIRTGKVLSTIKCNSVQLGTCAFTADGNYIVSTSNELNITAIKIWDICNNKLLTTYYVEEYSVRIALAVGYRNLIIAGDSSGGVYIFSMKGVLSEPPIITPIHHHQFKYKSHYGNARSLCSWCDQYFTVSDEITNFITTINRNAALTPEESPCLRLPDEAWDEPRLLSKCPHCKKPLKFNPFIVDNRDRY